MDQSNSLILPHIPCWPFRSGVSIQHPREWNGDKRAFLHSQTPHHPIVSQFEIDSPLLRCLGRRNNGVWPSAPPAAQFDKLNSDNYAALVEIGNLRSSRKPMAGRTIRSFTSSDRTSQRVNPSFMRRCSESRIIHNATWASADGVTAGLSAHRALVLHHSSGVRLD